MITKILEVRDDGTFIPVIAIKMESADPVEAFYIHNRSGFPADGSMVIVMKLDGEHLAQHNPYNWGYSRTMRVAHKHIQATFDTLQTGDVVCVEYLMGERKTPKKSERPE
jgi:hypothetical protein